MVRARPSLVEMMAQERTEVEAWLSAEWAPRRRWVIADSEYCAEPLDDIVKRMVEGTVSEWGDPYLGFVDDAQWDHWERRRQERSPEGEPRPLLAWLVPSDAETAKAWRAHLAPLLRAALEQALTTFPLTHAGREIKDAITQSGAYDKDQSDGGFAELWEGTGPNGLSDAGEDWLELRYFPSETWMCDMDFKPGLWQRYRVLPDEIMAILDAYTKAEAAER
jgi:hypothetical protein